MRHSKANISWHGASLLLHWYGVSTCISTRWYLCQLSNIQISCCVFPTTNYSHCLQGCCHAADLSTISTSSQTGHIRLFCMCFECMNDWIHEWINLAEGCATKSISKVRTRPSRDYQTDRYQLYDKSQSTYLFSFSTSAPFMPIVIKKRQNRCHPPPHMAVRSVEGGELRHYVCRV